ncbi:uncharacterized protein ISCGN_022449 [Ixodes scapularis]
MTMGEPSALPAAVGQVLAKGPKFALQPDLKAPELVSLVRTVADRVGEEEKPRCVSEGVDCLVRSHGKNGRTVNLTSVVDSLVDLNLSVLVSDKEGSFVVLPKGEFRDKARLALEKNFREVRGVCLKKVKEEAKILCDRLDLKSLGCLVNRSKGMNLDAFFTAKTHKAGWPFRVIVTERGSWQRAVTGFLQKQLSTLSICGPFAIRSSDAVISYLKDDNPKSCRVFSVDVEDLFYSIPQKELLVAVNDCIEATAEVKFRNSCGVTVEGFLELLSFYLKSMLVQWEKGVFVQRNGICIGSCVAPVLSDIFLGQLDVSLEGALGVEGVIKMFRYVDDYLIFVEINGRADVVAKVSSVFEKLGKGLKFTFETPPEGCLQFFLFVSPFVKQPCLLGF